MGNNQDKINPYLHQLVISLYSGTMVHLGKVISPVTGKVERDINSASATIELLAMLEAKMKGNLTAEEAQLIEHLLFELRLNYVDERKKDTAAMNQAASSAPPESKAEGNREGDK